MKRLEQLREESRQEENDLSSCMPDNVNTEEEYYQYLSDIGCIKWEFVEWGEKSTGECVIKGCFEDKDFEAIGIKNCGEIVCVKEIKRI